MNPLFDRLFAPYIGEDTPFLILPDGSVLTHAAFFNRAGQFAHAFAALGLEPGDRLVVQLEKSPDMLAIYAAAMTRGVVFLPLNTAYTAAEVSYFLKDSGARVMICDSARVGALSSVAEEAGATLLDLTADGQGAFARLAADQSEVLTPVARDAGDLAALLYTSGTTGRSKGAMLSQDNLLSNAEVLTEYWRFGPSDVLLHALPIFHTHGLFVATNIMLLCGGAMLFLPKFDLDAVIRLLPQATTMMGVPTFYTRLLDDPRLTRDLVADMRLFISGSAPLLSQTHDDFRERTGHAILERYGMTETNMSTSNPYDGDRRAGTVGFPLPGVELKITDPATGKTVPQGEIGQIEVRGSNVFSGYWQMPEKTREELRADGFFITGDLGMIDERGYVHIVGRNKDLIISGGFNIYPKEIEQLIDAQPGVVESAVVGVPHPDFGETPIAVVVIQPGTPGDMSAIKAAVAADLARFKQPRDYVVATDLPRNAMGKVQKNILRDQFKDLFAG